MIDSGEESRDEKKYHRGESYIFGEDMTNNYGAKRSETSSLTKHHIEILCEKSATLYLLLSMRKLVDLEKDFNGERKKSVDVKEQIVEAIGGNCT